MSSLEQITRSTRFQFHAMDTSIEVQLCAGREEAEHAVSLVKNWFESQEHCFSRSVADSELNRLNHGSGWMPVSAAMDEVLSLAYGYIHQTEGIYQPSMTSALQSSEFNVSSESTERRLWPHPLLERLVRMKTIATSNTWEDSYHSSSPGWIHREGSRMVHMDPGTELDLSGIVRGWAAERIANWLQRTLRIPAGMINVGGDIQVWGTGDRSKWTLEVADPFQGQVSRSVRLQQGAVATSRSKRRPLIDPRTMKPADTDVLQCTVLGQHVSQCEVVADTICILGSTEAVRWLNRHYNRHDVLWMTRDGDMYFRGNMDTLAEHWPGFDPDHRFSFI